MSKSQDEMKAVLVRAFVGFRIIANHSVLPTQKEIATDRAGNCLWALGVEEYEGFRAIEPEPLGDTIDGAAIHLVETK
ncbi:hypothetical protein [Salipiger mucosus]|uniref:Uncharacterized protein n=1 Tax=Salipiger mucosus DSM 16094 TaxID=1123237 RepID=S9QLM8_9RHOB|nr:hypothetical protein [Salipiger mucosus]EPX80498.1 hypothetical protein Salmuc_03815 [Salipiger mucosus DSM 16094]